MANVSELDINTIVDSLEMELNDLDLLVAVGRTAEQLVSSVAPKLLDYINSFLFALYEPQESPLESQTLTILSWLCIGEVLSLAYRNSVISEKEWSDLWLERANSWLTMIAKGKMGLSSPSRQTNYTPKFDGEPRYFTMRSSDDFTRTGILDLNTLFGE